MNEGAHLNKLHARSAVAGERPAHCWPTLWKSADAPARMVRASVAWQPGSVLQLPHLDLRLMTKTASKKEPSCQDCRSALLESAQSCCDAATCIRAVALSKTARQAWVWLHRPSRRAGISASVETARAPVAGGRKKKIQFTIACSQTVYNTKGTPGINAKGRTDLNPI